MKRNPTGEEEEMKRIRIFSVVLFLVSLAIFGTYKFYNVTVKDNTGPKITMQQESITVSVNDSEEKLLEGITAEDEKSGDVTDSLIVESKGPFLEEGRRKITIAAFDEDNHVTKASREVIYGDYHSPRFALSAPLRFPIGEENILANMTALDVLDGDLTGNIKISSEYSLSPDTAGEYPMEFFVTNSAGDMSVLRATVEIYNPSEQINGTNIALKEYVVYTTVGTGIDLWEYVEGITYKGQEYLPSEPGVLTDFTPSQGQERTSITNNEVRVYHSIDVNKPGTYEVIYEFGEAAENTGRSRLIVIVE